MFGWLKSWFTKASNPVSKGTVPFEKDSEIPLEFHSLEDAGTFFKKYGQEKGFIVQKSSTRKNSKGFITGLSII
jgi:hypothetical protein